jgi:hypothetical protein
MPLAVVVIHTVQLIAGVSRIPFAAVATLIHITTLRTMVVRRRITFIFRGGIIIVVVRIPIRFAINIYDAPV